jgi:hypothetical protein
MLIANGFPQDLIISCNYDGTGLEWVDMFDNPALGWLVDETTGFSNPIITGSLPPHAPATDPILSPQWAHIHIDSVFVPDKWRGGVMNFFTWLATNGGAQRKVRGNFMATNLLYALDSWRQQNPGLWNPEPFPPL